MPPVGARGLAPAATTVVGDGAAAGPAVEVVVGGGVTTSGGVGLPEAALRTSAAPPEASKPEPATTHCVTDGHAIPFKAPVPVGLWMACPLEIAPVTGLSGTACPLDGSPSSFPTARHCETKGQDTALSIAARVEMDWSACPLGTMPVDGSSGTATDG